MFSWATEQIEKISKSETFEKLSNAVAPPPADAPSRFVYCCQKDDEQGAIQCLAEMPGAGTVVHQVKGQVPLHIACLHSMPNLIRHLMTQPGASIQVPDAAGNTPLHCAVMSNKSNALDVVKMLVTDYQALVTAKNSHGQSPYDVAWLNMVRQYLLPLQLQKETQEALDNGGRGLPPGIDLGGLKIQNHHLPPPPGGGAIPSSTGPPNASMYPPTPMGNASTQPPAYASPNQTAVGGGPQTSSAPPSGQYPQPPVAAPTSGPPPNLSSAPSSGNREYARTGGSSAAIYKPKGRTFVQADGFHSSSSDKRLQEKYGHSSAHGYAASAVPPPPSSGNADYVRQHSAPPSMSADGQNPYAGGLTALGGSNRPANRRYVAYDPVSGTQQPQATPPHSGNFYGGAGTSTAATTATAAPTNATMFNPGAAAAAAAPSATTPTTPYMPPPPYQQVQPEQTNFAAPPPPNQTPFAPMPAVNVFSTPNKDPAQVPGNVQMSPSHQQTADASSLFAKPAGSAADTFSAPPPAISNVPPTSIEVKAKSVAASSSLGPAASAPVAAEVFSAPSNEQVGSTTQTEASAHHHVEDHGDLRDVPLSTEASEQLDKANTAAAASAGASSAAHTFAVPPKATVAETSTTITAEPASSNAPTAADVFSGPSAAAADAPVDSLLGPAPAQLQPTASTEISDPEMKESTQNEEVPPHHDEDDVGDLDDVPLSPGKPKTLDQASSSDAPTSLFEDIGMPPPPFSKK